MVELAVVATSTWLAIFHFSTNSMEYVGWLAVLATFAHGQVADRMVEKQAGLEKPSVECYRWSLGYYLIKEICWLIYFVAFKSYAALCGCIVFLLYPVWRKLYRSFNG